MNPKKPAKAENPKDKTLVDDRLSGGEPENPPAEGEKDYLAGGPDDNCL